MIVLVFDDDDKYAQFGIFLYINVIEFESEGVMSGERFTNTKPFTILRLLTDSP